MFELIAICALWGPTGDPVHREFSFGIYETLEECQADSPNKPEWDWDQLKKLRAAMKPMLLQVMPDVVVTETIWECRSTWKGA